MENHAHILIVEDNPKIANVLTDYFTAAGYRATHVADGASAVARARDADPDLIILDLMLPEMDGIEVCQTVRTFSQVPIIMVTARVNEIDRLLGLEVGADDYVCKPFSPREVVARVRAHLRRARGELIQRSDAQSFCVEREAMRIKIGNEALALTPVEFRILSEMIQHPGRVYSRQQLLDFCHDDQRDIGDRTIDSHIKNIRRKIASLLPEIDCLQSVYGVGYRFELPDPA